MHDKQNMQFVEKVMFPFFIETLFKGQTVIHFLHFIQESSTLNFLLLL